MAEFSGCETCAEYVYNEDFDCYECFADLDEDEFARLISGTAKNCPYYRHNDEYKIVKKQM